MATDEIPEDVRNLYPDVPAESWVRLSKHRFEAPHPVPGARRLAVAAFGEAVAQSIGPGRAETVVQGVWAGLFNSAAELAVHRLSCGEGTPIVGADRACHWCGRYPDEHRNQSAKDGK